MQAAIGEEEYRWFEWQANSFAGLLMVPGAPLKNVFQNVAATLSTAGVPPQRLDHYPTREYVIRELAKPLRTGHVASTIEWSAA